MFPTHTAVKEKHPFGGVRLLGGQTPCGNGTDGSSLGQDGEKEEILAVWDRNHRWEKSEQDWHLE